MSGIVHTSSVRVCPMSSPNSLYYICLVSYTHRQSVYTQCHLLTLYMTCVWYRTHIVSTCIPNVISYLSILHLSGIVHTSSVRVYPMPSPNSLYYICLVSYTHRQSVYPQCHLLTLYMTCVWYRSHNVSPCIPNVTS